MIEAMLCVGCGEDCLHQTGMIWFQRSEDAKKGTAYFVQHGQSGKYEFEDYRSANPSTRRHGSIVIFECELCHTITGLSFAQHKGHTHVDRSELSDRLTVKTIGLFSEGEANGTIQFND